MLCEYGCEKSARYKLSNGKYCCEKNFRSCTEVRRKNSEGVKRAHQSDTNNCRGFTDAARIKSREVILAKAIKNAFVEESTVSNEFIKKKLVSQYGVEEKCDVCGIMDWLGKSLCLELDHINGVSHDNRPQNLRFLCPNCHTQSDTFRGRNINNGKQKVSDEKFVDVLRNSKNIRRALLKLKLAPKGANYEKAKYLIEKHNIIMEQ